jgi:hypothetical protein
VGIVGKCQANARDKMKLANGGTFELFPDVKPRKSIFSPFRYNSGIHDQSLFYQLYIYFVAEN